MDGKEIVVFQPPGTDADDHTGPFKTIEVTAYRTTQLIRAATFAVPTDFTRHQIDDYLEATFAYLGLYEIFSQEYRYCHRVDEEEVYGDDEPEKGYEWTASAGE